jgi:anti-anti-sigma factor
MFDTLCRVEIEREAGFPVAKIVGEVDISNVEQVEKALESLQSGHDRICVVDLTGGEYFDSAGIRLLFSLAMRMRTRRQELHVIVPEGSVIRRVLEITDFSRVVPVHASMRAFIDAGIR